MTRPANVQAAIDELEAVKDKLKVAYQKCYAPLIAYIESLEGQGWRTDMENVPDIGPFITWCRWYLVPDTRTTSPSAEPYWSDWAPRWTWRALGRLQGTGDGLYQVKEVEATHWRHQYAPPSTDTTQGVD